MAIVVQAYTKRPQRNFQQDGLVDIACGSAILAIAFVLYTNMIAVEQINAAVAAGESYPIAWRNRMPLILGGIMLANAWIPLSFHLVGFAKKRFIYPRLGYFQPRVVPMQQSNVRILFGCLLVLAITLGNNFLRTQLPDFWSVYTGLIAIGIVLSVLLVINYWKQRFVRHMVLAATSLVASISLANMHLDAMRSFLFLSLILGVSGVIAGLFPLVKILKTPVYTEHDPE